MRNTSPLARLQLLPDRGNVVVTVAPVLRVAASFALGERLLEIRAKHVVVHTHPVRRHGLPRIHDGGQRGPVTSS
jgi:hypothetical protein